MMPIPNPFETLIKQNQEILDRLIRLEKAHTPDKKPVLPKYFRIEEVMKLTGWSRATIYGKTHRRELPVIKAAKRLMFPAEDLIKHLESQARPVLTQKI